MKLEQQVCSLELARKLKELGVKQESLFYWFTSIKGQDTLLCFEAKLPTEYSYDFEKDCSAYTVAELGEMLPWLFDRIDDNWILKISKTFSEWKVSYIGQWQNGSTTEFSHNLADAMAKMLIYLLENKLITL
jgi:hypothetical protein